nr:hypothetical protein [Prevotella sp.]
MQNSACHPEAYGRPATVLSNGRYVLLNQDSTLKWCSVEKDYYIQKECLFSSSEWLSAKIYL